MVNTLSLKDLRPALPKVIDRIDDKLDRYVITKRGRPIAVMMSIDDYDALMETLDILDDPATMKRIRQGRKDARHGRYRSWQEIKKSLA